MIKTYDIRGSMLYSYQDCNLRGMVQQYWREFRAAGYTTAWIPMSVPAQVGISSHVSVSHMLKNKIALGTLGDVDEAVQAGVQDFEDACKKTDFDFGDDNVTPSKSVGVDQIATIARTYAGFEGFRMDPLLVEERFVVSLNRLAPPCEACNGTKRNAHDSGDCIQCGGTGRKFGMTASGRIDNFSKQATLSDLKTGKTGASYMLQSGHYSLILKGNTHIAEALELIQIQRNKKGEPPNRPKTNYFDKKAAEQAAYYAWKRLINDLDTFLTTGNALQIAMNPNSWLCSEKACPAFGWCPMGRAKAAGDL